MVIGRLCIFIYLFVCLFPYGIYPNIWQNISTLSLTYTHEKYKSYQFDLDIRHKAQVFKKIIEKSKR